MYVTEMRKMLKRLNVGDDGYVVTALYKFVCLDHINVLRQQLQLICDKWGFRYYSFGK